MQNVYIANFGQQNYEWPTCLEQSSIATMNETSAQPFWAAGDREGYIASRMTGKTAAGLTPTRAVASRWFNLMSIIAGSSGDIWVHTANGQVWWTVSLPDAPVFIEKTEPVGRKRDVIVCHKPCEPWRKVNRKGNQLLWSGLHPKAKDFLATESTLQRLNDDYASYVLAMIAGDSLDHWHDLPIWRRKVEESRHRSTGGVVFNSEQLAVVRMASTAYATVAQSNGQTVQRVVKSKDMGFASQHDLELHIKALLDLQERLCILSDLPLNLDERDGDPQMRASLDRIDSNGPYAEGNLQIVCRFVNFWKSNTPDDEFRRLIHIVMRQHG